MSQRPLLLGTAQGPWCGIESVRQPVLRVRGLEDGEVTVSVQLRGRETPMLFSFASDGDYELAAQSGLLSEHGAAWIRAEASHPSKGLICTIIRKAAA